MNKEEARELLDAAIENLKAKSRSELEQLVNKVKATTVNGDSGKRYNMETQAFWDDKKGQDLRVLVSMDDGGWHAFSPMSESFIVAPDGSFVGE